MTDQPDDLTAAEETLRMQATMSFPNVAPEHLVLVLAELDRLRQQRKDLLWFCEGIETQAEETGRFDLTIQDVREYLGDLESYDVAPPQP